MATISTNPIFSPTYYGTEGLFLEAWIQAINVTGHKGLFGTGTGGVLNSYAPKIKEINRALPFMPKSKAALIAAMVSFYNPEEGARLMHKAGVSGLGNLAQALGPSARAALGELFFNYHGW